MLSKLLMYHSYIFTATFKLGDVVHAAILKEHTRGICASKFRNVYAKQDISLPIKPTYALRCVLQSANHQRSLAL